MASSISMVAGPTSTEPPEHNGKVDINGTSAMKRAEFAWIEHVAMPIFAVDFSMHIAGWNRKAAENTKISSQEVIGQSFEYAIHENYTGAFQSAAKEIEKGADASKCTVAITGKGGELRHFHAKLSSQHNASGQSSGIICFLEETESKMHTSPITPISECALPESVSNRLNMPFAGLTIDGMIVWWNSELQNITGYRSEEVQGRLFMDFLPDTAHRDQVQALLESVETSLAPDTPQQVEFLTADNTLKRLLIQAFSYKESDDNAGRVLMVVTDAIEHPSENGSSQMSHVVSTSQSNEIPTQQSENKFENFHTPVFGINLSGEIDDWNQTASALLEYSRRQVIGKPFLESFIDPFFHAAIQEALILAIGENDSPTIELELQTSSGDVRYLLSTFSPRKDTSGQVVGVTVFAQDITESTQNNHAVASMARELRQLLDTANLPIFGVDTEGCVNEWNDTTAEVTGLSGDDVFQRQLTETCIPPQFQPAIEEIINSGLRGRGTSNFELEIRTKSNEIRFLLLNATTRRDIEENVVGVVFVAQDVTEACKHDRAVAAMANELRQLIDTANAPIFGIDRDGDVNEWNDKTAEITGYTKEEAFDCSLIETFIVPSMRDSVQDVLDNALEGRGTSNYELEFRTKSNEIRHLLVNATTRRDAENNVVGVVGVAQDVTEAVQRDRAVAGMALELRQLIDTANAPIFGIDIDGNVNEWNRRTSEITGYMKEEAFDEPLVETFIAESMQDKVQEILDSALAGNETSNYELEFVSKSGEPIFLLVNATTRRDPENVVVGVVGVAQDVTEDRKHAQALREMQYLRASQEAKVETERNMTAYFAHELRNPLGAIDSALNAMPDELPEAARSLISGMQLCTGFMSSIMNNLLDVRKMEEGKMTLSKSPISLKKLLNNVHKMLLPSLRPGVKFEKVCRTKSKDWVLGDAHRIQQVMTNVVTNAIKYTVTGSVTLIIGWEDDNVKFECVDTGPGIPKNEQEKLFQRFVQRGGAPGTGLGLAIAKHLVDLTKGSIRFDSDPTVKAGTTCVVLMKLPLCDAPESVVEVSTALIEEPITFLIIDDIKMNRMMLKRRIMKGIAPNSVLTEAATGEEALEILGGNKFDVIVVDQYMEEAGGVMVGTDVVFAMRRMRIDSVIIGCSGNDMGTQFFEAGADWVWQKPMPSNVKIIQDLRASLNKRASLRKEGKT